MKSRLAAALVMTAWLVPCKAAHAADPTTADCLAASEASLSSRNEHRLRSERAQALVCGAASCPADIRNECTRRLDEVNAAIPTIVFEVTDATGNDLSAVRVTMDRDVLAERLEGTALSIDPGEHTFIFETAGQPPLEKRFMILEAQKERRELIRFGAPVQCPADTQRTLSGECARTVPPLCTAGYEWSPGSKQCLPAGDAASSRMGTQRVLGWVSVGVGAVSLGAGVAFGLLTLAKKSDAQDACPNRCATQSGVSQWDDAVTAGNVSTALFVVGGVAVAGGAVLLWTAKPQTPSQATIQLGLGPASLRVNGAW